MGRFKPGERVEVIKNNSIAAKIGHKATVVHHNVRYLDVKWDRPSGATDKFNSPFGQMNGSYNSECFRRIETDWDE